MTMRDDYDFSQGAKNPYTKKSQSGSFMIRPLGPDDTKAALELVSASGLFSPQDMETIKIRLGDYIHGTGDSLWIIHVGQDLDGLLYCLPEPMTHGTWNILMLLVRGSSRGKGVGTALMKEAQKLLIEQNARLLMVETSGTEDFEGAQRFYSQCGFVEVARIPDFYDDGDYKVIFTKTA